MVKDGIKERKGKDYISEIVRFQLREIMCCIYILRSEAVTFINTRTAQDVEMMNTNNHGRN